MRRRSRTHDHSPERTELDRVWLDLFGPAQLRQRCRCGLVRFVDEITREPVTAWNEPEPNRGD